jgi:catechol 2,3-dioxygenase-like lactoylglutathione lyase family enzyme
LARGASLRFAQHADEHRPEDPVLFAVDQKLCEDAALRVALELSDPVGPVDVGKHQDVEELGAGSRAPRASDALVIGARARPVSWSEATPSTVPRGQHRDRCEGVSSVEVRASYMRRMVGDMTIQRMDNVAIVVDDLDAAVAFFTELGMELEGKGQVEGLFADRTVGLDGVRTDIAMMRTPDGHSKLELTEYHTPAAVGAEPENPPPNTLGLHRVMFAVDDINDTVARLRAHGAELLGEVAQYESSYLLCYLRGPAGIIVALAEQID